MINATKKALEFYKKQAESYVPKVVDFYMFNDKFENAKKSMESKSKKDLTKDEIDNYNSMVKQINKEVENYNKNNNSNFQDKQNAVNSWNITGENFISRYVPKD